MLEGSFQIFPRVGEKTERKLWDKGITSWKNVLNSPRPADFSGAIWAHLQTEVQRHQSAIDAGDYPFLARYVPTPLVWRLVPSFAGRIAYFDIETTGLSPGRHHVTTIAVYDGHEVHDFIRGENLDEFPDFIARFPAIASFYGRGFDVPFLKQELKMDFPQVHFDVCFLMKAAGYRGGLKNIERIFGISRGDLDGIDGWEAVKLWHQYRKTNDRRYLDTLIAYNNEDVVHLEFLLNQAYNILVQKHQCPFPLLPLGNTVESRVAGGVARHDKPA